MVLPQLADRTSIKEKRVDEQPKIRKFAGALRNGTRRRAK